MRKIAPKKLKHLSSVASQNNSYNMGQLLLSERTKTLNCIHWKRYLFK